MLKVWSVQAIAVFDAMGAPLCVNDRLNESVCEPRTEAKGTARPRAFWLAFIFNVVLLPIDVERRLWRTLIVGILTAAVGAASA
jgi:hypothetical protein